MIRKLAGLIFATACLVALMAMPLLGDQATIKAGREVVDAWLVLQDAGKYDETWEQSAAYVKKLLNQQKVVGRHESAAGPAGRCEVANSAIVELRNRVARDAGREIRRADLPDEFREEGLRDRDHHPDAGRGRSVAGDDVSHPVAAGDDEMQGSQEHP